jgi:hypothetical protein
MSYENQAELVGYIDLFESNPEYKTVLYGSLTIPLALIDQAIEAKATRDVKGSTCVSLDVQLYDFDREWKISNGAPPILTGKIKLRRPRTNSGSSDRTRRVNFS